MPLTQIMMDQQSITLSVGPEGMFAQITMDATGITETVMGGISSVSITPASVSTMSPTISETAMATIEMMAPTINEGLVVSVEGAMTVDGLAPMLLPA